jgi:hypothetical protein
MPTAAPLADADLLRFNPAAMLALRAAPSLMCRSVGEEFVGLDKRSGPRLITEAGMPPGPTHR